MKENNNTSQTKCSMKKKVSSAESTERNETAEIGVNHTSDLSPLEKALGLQIKEYRLSLDLTVALLASNAGLSPGMLSKIENGQTSPSLATLRALAGALNVPVTSLFRKFEEQRDASYVQNGQGLLIERRGSRSGHEYRLLGHTVGHKNLVEPYLITLNEGSEVFPLFQHEGQEFLYMLTGEVKYRYGNSLYHMCPGDSLFFDADAPHGPEELLQLPATFLAFIVKDS